MGAERLGVFVLPDDGGAGAAAVEGVVAYSDGVMRDLNDLIPAGSGFTLTHAQGLNDAGQVAGYGTVDGVTHGFLLTPVPAPSSLALASLGGLVLLSYGGWRRWATTG
jgi:hypothetical protein